MCTVLGCVFPFVPSIHCSVSRRDLAVHPLPDVHNHHCLAHGLRLCFHDREYHGRFRPTPCNGNPTRRRCRAPPAPRPVVGLVPLGLMRSFWRAFFFINNFPPLIPGFSRRSALSGPVPAKSTLPGKRVARSPLFPGLDLFFSSSHQEESKPGSFILLLLDAKFLSSLPGGPYGSTRELKRLSSRRPDPRLR